MSAPKVANTTKITLRSRYSELIQKIFKQSDEPINNWEKDWTHLASKGEPAGSWWKRVSTQITKETEARAQQQVWQAVHEEDLEPPPHLQATPCEAPNFFVCPKCKTEQHKYFFRRHLKTCDGTPPPKTAMCHKPVVSCKDCSKQIRNPRQHRSFCKKKNKITRRLWGKQAPGQRPVQQRQPNLQGSGRSSASPTKVVAPLRIVRRLRGKQSVAGSSSSTSTTIIMSVDRTGNTRGGYRKRVTAKVKPVAKKKNNSYTHEQPR